ncbi:hypothetical protein [Streptomyces glaucus]|uniref:Uncharacterized protein n=1 Tax=Streptomyces glaucus TaxID=284029 RepID=A0ABP5X5A5_9ACTN
MTKATRLGPYTYLPAPAHGSPAPNGALTKGGLPVTLRVTEPILRNFLDILAELEADLGRRWITAQGTSGRRPAE